MGGKHANFVIWVLLSINFLRFFIDLCVILDGGCPPPGPPWHPQGAQGRFFIDVGWILPPRAAFALAVLGGPRLGPRAVFVPLVAARHVSLQTRRKRVSIGWLLVASGTELIAQGAAARHLLYVVEGELSVLRDGQKVATLVAGDYERLYLV